MNCKDEEYYGTTTANHSYRHWYTAFGFCLEAYQGHDTSGYHTANYWCSDLFSTADDSVVSRIYYSKTAFSNFLMLLGLLLIHVFVCGSMALFSFGAHCLPTSLASNALQNVTTFV